MAQNKTKSTGFCFYYFLKASRLQDASLLVCCFCLYQTAFPLGR